MVDETGRGKTHISRRLGNYLSFFHAMPVGMYQLAHYRMKLYGATTDAEWFDPHNETGKAVREACLKMAVTDVTEFLRTNTTGIAIFDSTNPTYERRVQLMREVLY